MALKLCTEFSIGDEARSRGVDLFKTLSVYNLRHWFDGSTAGIALDLDTPVVALVNVDGYTKIFASKCKEIDLYVEKLLWSLGIYEDISGFQSIASRDPLLSRFSIEWSGWRLRSSDLWWALVIGVCQQNASFRQGWSMVINIVDIYGRAVELENNGEVVLPHIQVI